MHNGCFITFEGLDGSGKSTQLRLVSSALLSRGCDVVSLRQPGGTALGERIRELLLDSRSDTALGGICPEAELALMFADRAQSLAQVIRPALAERAIVLCDRYTDSSEAYQGAGRGIGPERVRVMHDAICAGFQPQLTVLLLPPLATSLFRARRRNQRHLANQGTDENRFERESDVFYQRIHRAYEEIARREPQRVVMIANDSSIDAIEMCIASVVTERLAADVSWA